MAPQTTKAFILRISPFRESSCILYLLTPEHGLVHGVAKGVKRKKACVPSLERGFLVETLLYSRPHRDMHTLGGIGVLDYYPSTRTDLYKSVVRDIAFETLFKTMSCDSSHPEVFSYFADWCRLLETAEADACFPAMIWQFFFHFSRLMGVAPSIDVCSSCGRPLRETEGAFLLLESGGMACPGCGPTLGGTSGAFLPASVLRLLWADFAEKSRACSMPVAEIRRITRLFSRYCQYHFHHASEFKSIAFLESLLPDTEASRRTS